MVVLLSSFLTDGKTDAVMLPNLPKVIQSVGDQLGFRHKLFDSRSRTHYAELQEIWGNAD